MSCGLLTSATWNGAWQTHVEDKERLDDGVEEDAERKRRCEQKRWSWKRKDAKKQMQQKNAVKKNAMENAKGKMQQRKRCNRKRKCGEKYAITRKTEIRVG
jgi:hypothetical protein